MYQAPTAPKLRIIPYERVKEIVLGIPELRTRALMAVQYGLGARIGELLSYFHYNSKHRHETDGLLRENIRREMKADRLVWFCAIPNFKKSDVLSMREPFFLDDELFISDTLRDWLKVCGRQVFDLKISRVRSLITEALPDNFSTHALRHSRATHLRRTFGLPIEDVQDFLGHSSLDTTKIYTRASVDDAVEKMGRFLERS